MLSSVFPLRLGLCKSYVLQPVAEKVSVTGSLALILEAWFVSVFPISQQMTYRWLRNPHPTVFGLQSGSSEAPSDTCLNDQLILISISPSPSLSSLIFINSDKHSVSPQASVFVIVCYSLW